MLTHPNARNVSIVIYETPLVADEVQFEDMVIDLVRVLVKAAECIYMVVSAVRH
jgi:hypothetical protein